MGGKKYSMDKSLTSGSMGMMLLKLLSEKDMYGYEMIETLRQRSQNVFELKAGTLYPLLPVSSRYFHMPLPDLLYAPAIH